MQPIEFQCPECAAKLRLKDRSHLQRIIPCPDCKERLQLQTDGDRFIASRLDADVAPVNRGANPTQVANTNTKSLLTPRNVSFLVAGLVLLTFGTLMLWSTGGSTATADTRDDNVEDVQKPVAKNSAVLDAVDEPTEEKQPPQKEVRLNIDPPAPPDDIPDGMAIVADQANSPSPPLVDSQMDDVLSLIHI